MEWSCLLVDLAEAGLVEAWQTQAAGQQFPMPIRCVSTVDEANAMLNSGSILLQVLFAKGNNEALQGLLRAFQTNVGCIADFQAIVCDEPSPLFMASVFEFGIEQFFGSAVWPQEVAAMMRNAIQLVADPTSAEAKTINLARSIRSADQGAIKKAASEIGELAEYDYRLAYAKGKAAEAAGEYDQAADAYKAARGMNKMFRPSSTSLGETLLVTGKVDEALEVFKALEKTNPYDVERKANLASAYVEKGDFEMAQKYVDAAAKLAPGNSRVLEAKAQVMLCTGKIGDAVKLMDQMSDVGPFFAAKLNELGIKLSQSGQGKSALALYQKAHKIVRPELRYKITLNAALACRRLNAWEMGLKYLARCEKEFGSAFPKLLKIREAMMAGMKQEAAAKAGAAKPESKKAG